MDCMFQIVLDVSESYSHTFNWGHALAFYFSSLCSGISDTNSVTAIFKVQQVLLANYSCI